MRIRIENKVITWPLTISSGGSITSKLNAGIPIVMCLNIFYTVVVTTNEYTIVTGTHDFKTFNGPEMPE
ncbi:hypothetical protein D3C76_1417750 [compost metagenome]